MDEEKTYSSHKFNSVADFQNAVDEMKRKSYMRNESENDGEDFTGTKSYEQAVDLLVHGDRKLADKLGRHGVSKSAKVFATRPRKKVVRGQCGFMPNIPAYIAKEKKAMFNMEYKRVRNRVITIVYDSTIHCGISTDQAIETSAKLMRTIQRIEAGGTRVNLYVSQTITDRHGFGLATIVKIKESGTYLDVLKMVYPMVHPSFFRRQGFKIVEAYGTRHMVYGYGCPMSFQYKGAERVKKAVLSCRPPKGSYLVNYEQVSRCKTDEELEQFIYKNQIN